MDDVKQYSLSGLQEQLKILVEFWNDDRPYRDDEYWVGVRACADQVTRMLDGRLVIDRTPKTGQIRFTHVLPSLSTD